MPATVNGEIITFKKNKSELVYWNGTNLKYVYNRLYYLMSTENKPEDCCQGCYNIHTRHRILGHCNCDDIKKLPNVIQGMKIKEKIDTLDQDCEICFQGKFSQSRNKQPDRCATSIFELVHTDLAGPIDLVNLNGHRYAITFTDDFSNAVFVYFLKSKNDTVSATKKFIADTNPYDRIKSLRSDNGSESKSNDFLKLLCDNSIRHETSALYSPHQNVTAKKWRTLFEMVNCMIIENSLPKNLWTYAVMTSAVIRRYVSITVWNKPILYDNRKET